MGQIDAIAVREKILNLIKEKGPSLPIHISKATGLQLIFSGAFLSELVEDKIIKMSDLKVGGSHLYYLPGQEAMLENFYTYLGGKEKEAFIIIKEKKILRDSELEPAIRVALRAINDFALPTILNFNNEKLIFWRFYNIAEEEAKERISNKLQPQISQQITPQIQPLTMQTINPTQEIPQQISPQITPQIQEQKAREPLLHPELTKKKVKAGNEDFLNKIKENLTAKNLPIIKVEYYDKKEVILISQLNNQSTLIIAFNKKKINEKELIKAYKKSLLYKMPYVIILREELSKKMKEQIDASRALISIEKL